MSPDRNVILVVDVEATCWNTPDNGTPRYSEIIEIGVARVRMDLRQVEDYDSVLVRPERSVISSFCTELTTITPEMAATGMRFGEACDWLRDRFSAQLHPWMSDGNYDRNKFIDQCRDYGVDYPFSDEHINLSTLVKKYVGNGQRMGIANALKRLSETPSSRVTEPFQGTAHRAGDDALNAARLFCEIEWRFLGWNYPRIGIHVLNRDPRVGNRGTQP